MQSFLSRKAQAIEPYVPGEQPKTADIIKLNTNENPFPPSPKVLEAISGQVEKLRLYPEIDGETLRCAIAKNEGLQPDEVFVGNGSDEVLAFCFPAFFNADEEIFMPEITYTFYEVYATLFGNAFRKIPMIDTLDVDVDKLLSGSGGVILANPNAPTSKVLPLETIEKMALKQLEKGKVLVVDEAYAAFTDQPSAATLISKYPNLCVTRTMSKDHSMAGLRVGYALGQASLLSGLIRIKDSFNSYPLDRLAIVGATAAIEDVAYFNDCMSSIKATRAYFTEGLRARGFVLPDSNTNFVFCRHESVSGKFIFDELRKRNILVRRFDKPAIREYMRMTIGTQEQMKTVLSALDEILK